MCHLPVGKVPVHAKATVVSKRQNPVVISCGIKGKLLDRVIPLIGEFHECARMRLRADSILRIYNMALSDPLRISKRSSHRSSCTGQYSRNLSCWLHRPNSWGIELLLVVTHHRFVPTAEKLECRGRMRYFRLHASIGICWLSIWDHFH